MMSEFIPVVIFCESSLPLCILSTCQPELINKVAWYCILIERLTFLKDFYNCPIWYSGTRRVRYEVFKGFLQKSCSKKFRKIHRSPLVLPASSCHFIKILRRRCFPVNFAKFYRTTFIKKNFELLRLKLRL